MLCKPAPELLTETTESEQKSWAINLIMILKHIIEVFDYYRMTHTC